MRHPQRLSATTGRGLLLAAAILLGWLTSLAGLLSLPPGQLPWWVLLAAVPLRTLLHTGLFITAHDAMHGLLLPQRPGWNTRLGALALALYGALPYRRCLANHRRHHRRTASPDDPDFHGDPRAGALGWYLRFMAGYLSLPQMAWLLGAWGMLALLAGRLHPGGELRVLLVCTLPLLLSSLQLFVFGTYLPHRRQRAPQHRSGPDSLDLPAWLSLLACFHFSYHREHHEHPTLAWFELPAQRRRSLALAPAGYRL